MIRKVKKTLVKYNRFIISGLLALLQAGWMSFFYFSAFANDIYISAAIRITSIFFILYILNKKDSPAFKLPWSLLIAVMPFFGILLYFFFGNGNPTRLMRQKIKNAKFTVPEGYLEKLAEGSKRAVEKVEDARARGTNEYLENSCFFPAYENNGMKYFPTGEEMFLDIKEKLHRAEKFIFIEFFIIEEGKMWGEISEILIKKAQNGVDVRIIYDDFGTMSALPKSYPKKVEAWHENIHCIKFNPVNPMSLFSANCRDHRKIIVIDGEWAYTGGLNIADRYINEVSPYGYWKDSGLRVDGAASDSFTLMFAQMWNAFSDDRINTADFIGKCGGKSVKEGVVHPYCDAPHEGDNVTENILIDMIGGAKKRVYIFTPYLIIDNELRTVLCNAAKRGVDVKAVIPGIPDKKVVYRLTRANYRLLVEAGIEIYKYTPGFIHSKVYLVDDDAALVSTANMDYRSLYLQFECGAYIYGAQEIKEIEGDIANTIKICEKVDPETLERDGLFTRIFDSVLRAFETLF